MQKLNYYQKLILLLLIDTINLVLEHLRDFP